MKGHPIHTVDVFAESPLAGNQLAVVLDAQDLAPEVMQRIAKEMNIAETTFVLPPDDPAHAAKVRIFTPTVEMPFAGHPTVGTAWVLHSQGLVPGGALEFALEEPVGPVLVRGQKAASGTTFWLTTPPLAFGETLANRGEIVAAIGLAEADLLAEVPIQEVTTGNPFAFVALRDARAVDAAVPDEARLAAVFHGRAGLPIFLFAPLGSGRLYSRMFAGHVLGIREDPATGSASGPLGAFAVKHGLLPRGSRVKAVSEQGTKMGRQSFIHIELDYPDGGDVPRRIEVGGAVRPVIVGTLSEWD
jgi:trans-2,3-dihydro-3-hydroxyanthranilate isomerase